MGKHIPHRVLNLLVPEIRSHLPAADLALKIHIPNVKDEGVRSPSTAEHHVTVNPGRRVAVHDIRNHSPGRTDG